MTALVKQEPSFASLFDSLFRPVWGDAWNSIYRNNPLFDRSTRDLKETDTEFQIEVSLPGFKRDEISVTANSNMVRVEAVKGDESYLREFSYLGVEHTKVTATLENGVLTLKIPKVQKEESKDIKIDIK